jgi:hypothetical protein
MGFFKDDKDWAWTPDPGPTWLTPETYLKEKAQNHTYG